jgi:hypothetical protein
MIEFQPPNKVKDGLTVFLAGSIGVDVKAEEWQRRFIDALAKENYRLLNPRRADWDSSWEQSINNPKFKEQVLWELDGLEMADIIVMYFDPKTSSPISLLELGLYARSKKLIVLCPEGFWRKGNVDIVCEKYNIKVVSTFQELIDIFITKNE